MSKYTGIPFRHDVVGSFLRPQAIHDARRAFEAGTLTAEELRAIEDREIKALVEKEKANGIKPLLCDVLADIRGKAMFADSSTIEIDDIVLEEILSKYFA